MSAPGEFSAADLVEATSVSTRSEGHQFEIQLGHLCNNRCVFCSSGQLTELRLARPIRLDPMIAAIEEARAGGARRITFLGGEPTIHKGFLAALRRTVELGFEEIVIFTNGVMLPHPGFIDSVVALGRTFEWRISIQGGNEEAHVATTGRKDSYQRILFGLRRLRELGQLVTSNMCVNERSYRSLPDYPALVGEHGIKQLHIDIVRPSSAGARTPEYLAEIMPRYSVMAPYFREMLERFDRELPGFDVNIGNLPFCILPEWSNRIGHGGEATITKSSNDHELEDAVDKYAWHASMRRHTPRCESCVFRKQCTGIFSAYLEAHGDEEFQPVSREQLATLDPRQNGFVFLAAPLIETLVSRAAPAGWSAGSYAPDPRQRRMTYRLHTSRGANVALHFTPSDRGGAPLLSTRRFSVTIEIEGEVGAEALRVLLVWLSDAVSALPGVVVDAPIDFTVATEQLRDSRALAKGRARVERMVREVERRAPMAAWRAARRRARADGRGTIVELEGPEASRIDVLFEIDTRGGRSQVSLDFRLGDGTDEGRAWPVVQELIRALREPDTAAPA